MLSEEQVFKLWNSHPNALSNDEGVVAFARAIEAAVQAERQEPVKDEPVAWIAKDSCLLLEEDRESKIDAIFLRNWNPLYTHPQPDPTVEVERLKSERDSFYMDYRMKCGLETKQQAEQPISHDDWYALCNKYDAAAQKAAEQAVRIAEIEAAAREAREVIRRQPYTMDKDVCGAIAKLDAVLGNA